MEFNEKLQQLRKEKGLTQEELAARLFVSRTAVSKWESARGYPNIDSLKAIARLFSITLDELLSSDEALTLAERDNEKREIRFRDLIYGLLDLSTALLLFLPFFADTTGDIIYSTSLLKLVGIQPYMRVIYLIAVWAMVLMGILTLALQNLQASTWLKSKTSLSLSLGATSVLLFIISPQPYAAAFTFVLLAIKALLLIKRP